MYLAIANITEKGDDVHIIVLSTDRILPSITSQSCPQDYTNPLIRFMNLARKTVHRRIMWEFR